MLRENRCLPREEDSAGVPERTLLLMDDEVNIIELLKRVLRTERYRVLTAVNAVEGFERLAEKRVGVIVSDERMPEMRGIEFLMKNSIRIPFVSF